MHVFERVALFLVLLTAEAGFYLGLRQDYTCPAYACSKLHYNSVRCNNSTDLQWWNSPKCHKLRADEAERRRNQKKNKLPLVGVITLDGERYCAADGDRLYTDDMTKKAKSWLVGDPLNPNSYAAIASRVVFQRAEGLTFFVAQAGLKDDKGILRRIFRKISDFIGWSSKEKRRPVFKTAGVIEVPTNGTHNFTSNKSPYRIKSNQRTWFMNPPSKRKATHEVQTETGTEYTYSSDAIHEGLERAVHWLMDESVDAIVGDCGFDKGIQMTVNDIIHRYSLAAKDAKEVLVPPPALMSTLQLLPNMLAMLAKDAVLFVLTSNGASFKKDFNKLTENAPKDKVIVLGLEHVKHFGQEVEDGTSINDVEAWPGLEKAIEEKQKLLGDGKRLGGILCECTELPAYSNRIRKRFEVPVFDAMTCASLVASSVKRDDYVNRHERAKQQET